MPFSVTYEQAISCCAAKKFATALSSKGSFVSIQDLISAARKIWWTETDISGWLEALAAHPKIGDRKGVEEKKGQYGEFSRSEALTSSQTTTDAVAAELKQYNDLYFDKFGFIFIIFAKGKTAPQILSILKDRYHRLPYEELQTAATEQMKITELRLNTLFSLPNPVSEIQDPTIRRTENLLGHIAPPPPRSPVTTHVLDTATGRPAEGLGIKFFCRDDSSRQWILLSEGITNADGRIGNLLAPPLLPGRYRMFFDTTSYFTRCRQAMPAFYAEIPFYPEVVVEFEIVAEKAGEHYHIPLLLSPYGYSTYRGS
mmetsp:Transcript_31251/g.56733  ORF Transcript_31251/g.56733 Transcript_31251/m.56733 type:complete len:313 (-) Transcript_31251:270-1208(-)|eukprot:CAMPEP_0175050152 /NCGR_PEP_ID=MMETSP0052_2-20121109/7110_1 /TAXON_ID=51329 ORGANISM="Polytomella parva, Strain SAG 63-3" /NCGR_SAMPLE_ID=MMETSP0052_2 /ASSEMBLY_ACC=CAM_ASM_000194 /LENGTH=312 /DNA_ID=CAMNT_0016314343 /DNA_START=179 /DNA_END=1117 /DNA_ORIENTATION=-